MKLTIDGWVLAALALAGCGGGDFSAVGGDGGSDGGPLLVGGSSDAGVGGAGSSDTGAGADGGRMGGGGVGGDLGGGGGGPGPASSSATGAGGGGGGMEGGAGGGMERPCGPATCEGCCAADGTCQLGTTDDACGLAGDACMPCPDLCGWNPPNGVCSSGEGVSHRSCQAGVCKATKDGLGYTGACCDFNQHCELATLACEVN